MDASTEQQIGELLALREAHQRTLHYLQVQQAQHSSLTPPHIISGIENANNEINRIDIDIARLYVKETAYYTQEIWVKEHADDKDKLLVVYREIQRLESSFIQQINAVHLLLHKIKEGDDIDRLRRQNRTDRYYFAILFLLSLILILLIIVVLSSTRR